MLLPFATMLGAELIVTVGAVVLAPTAETVVLGCAGGVVEEVLACPFVPVVSTEPQADKPKVNANTTAKSR